MNKKICIGWIPHLNGAPFLTNRWWQQIRRKRTDGERVYFNFQRPDEKTGPIKPFNLDLIEEYFGLKSSYLIKETIKNSAYFAHCKPVDDTDPNERWFFVYRFKDDTLKHLVDVIIFKKFSFGPQGSTNYVLRYLATVEIGELDEDGFITLLNPTITTGNIVTDGFDVSVQYLEESFQAVRDILHHHSHHINSHYNGNIIGPDSIIRPVISDSNNDKSKIKRKIAEKYQICLLNHLEHITELASITGSNSNLQILKKGYSELISVIKQGNGVLIYYNQYLLELRKKSIINHDEHSTLKESAFNMRDAYQSFFSGLDTQFQMHITFRSDLILIITALLTFWIVFIEILTLLSDVFKEINSIKLYLILIPLSLTSWFFFKPIRFIIEERIERK
ncbi:hypothetical protein [Methanocalculus sp.]|uniref:hypothetical protein n=1 Tax=Methanocalculus sp. TaxID=2004547 RepID=UPI002602E54B|nr:hypothetical protein [Methanocalculus sp.]MDG6249624.1 hypothetical protein [Methanocalculus sp.]